MLTKFTFQRLLFLLPIVLLNSGCPEKAKCRYGDQTTHVYNTISAFNKAPQYVGNDTLVFISSTGDTSRLYGHGKSLKTYTHTSPLGTITDCTEPEYTYHDEEFTLQFTGSGELYNIYHDAYYTSVGEVMYYTINHVENRRTLGADTIITIKGNQYECYKTAQAPYIYILTSNTAL